VFSVSKRAFLGVKSVPGVSFVSLVSVEHWETGKEKRDVF